MFSFSMVLWDSLTEVSIPQVLHYGARSTRGCGTQWRSGRSGIWWMRSPQLCGNTVICVWVSTTLYLSGLTLSTEQMLTTPSKPMCFLWQRPCLSCTRSSTSTSLRCCGLMVMEMHRTLTGTAQGSSPGFITRGKATCTEVLWLRSEVETEKPTDGEKYPISFFLTHCYSGVIVTLVVKTDHIQISRTFLRGFHGTGWYSPLNYAPFISI